MTHFIDIHAHLERKALYLKTTVQEHPHELATSQRTVNQKEVSLNETITSLRENLHTVQTNSGAFADTLPCASLTSLLLSTSIEPIYIHIEETVQELRNQLNTANQEKDTLNETINSLRADLRAEQQSSGAFIATPIYASLRSTSVREQNHASRTHCPGTSPPT